MVRSVLAMAGIVAVCLISSLPPAWLHEALAVWRTVISVCAFSIVGLLVLAVSLTDPASGRDGGAAAFGELRAGGPSFRCPVCGTGGSGSRMVCSSCETPHHVECARWVGGCSTYGCQRLPSGAAPLLGAD